MKFFYLIYSYSLKAKFPKKIIGLNIKIFKNLITQQKYPQFSVRTILKRISPKCVTFTVLNCCKTSLQSNYQFDTALLYLIPLKDTHIVRMYLSHKCSIGFKSGDCEGHVNIF